MAPERLRSPRSSPRWCNQRWVPLPLTASIASTMTKRSGCRLGYQELKNEASTGALLRNRISSFLLACTASLIDWRSNALRHCLPNSNSKTWCANVSANSQLETNSVWPSPERCYLIHQYYCLTNPRDRWIHWLHRVCEI